MLAASRRSGRISFVLLAGICSLALLGFLLLSGGKSPRGAAGEFMTALARGDVDKLTELSSIQNKDKEQIRKDWEQSLHYGKNYLFFWTIDAMSQSGDTATAKLGVTKNPLSPSAYADHYELQLKKEGSDWKVDVTQMSRDMYPYLPR